MKKIVLLALAVALLSSCGMTNALYYWGGTQSGTTAYENLAYQSYDKQTPRVSVTSSPYMKKWSQILGGRVRFRLPGYVLSMGICFFSLKQLKLS